MSTTNVTSAEARPAEVEVSERQEVSARQESPAAIERRRRKRAAITAQLMLRVVNAPEPSEEVCMTVNVSRDGLLFTAARAGYWKGQHLDIIFPYSAAATAINDAQRAEIIRVSDGGAGKYAIAVQFLAAKADARTEKKREGMPFAAGGREKSAPLHEKQSVVLAVEPDVRSAEMMRAPLEKDGYTVVIVSTAKEALDILRSTVPVVFIAEVEGEEMGGQDLCLIIKRNDRLARVPVVLLTRSAQPADYSASHQMGAVVCMAKPFKPERLQHVVHLVAPPPATKNSYATSRPANLVGRTV